MEAVPWVALAQKPQHAQRARALLRRLLGQVYEAAELVRGPLFRPQVRCGLLPRQARAGREVTNAARQLAHATPLSYCHLLDTGFQT